MNVCSKELGAVLKQKGINIPVKYAWSNEKGKIVSNNGNLFYPLKKDIPLFTESQLDRLLPEYFEIAYIKGNPCIYNNRTSKYLDYTVSDTIINAKAKGLIIYLNIKPNSFGKINNNGVNVLQIYGDNNKMNIEIEGIDDWTTSEIKEIIENAFFESTPSLNNNIK
jgi:uncharacterized protein YbaR (Trm112 family)